MHTVPMPISNPRKKDIFDPFSTLALLSIPIEI